jgi:hypothetical protein
MLDRTPTCSAQQEQQRRVRPQCATRSRTVVGFGRVTLCAPEGLGHANEAVAFGFRDQPGQRQQLAPLILRKGGVSSERSASIARSTSMHVRRSSSGSAVSGWGLVFMRGL